MRRRLLNVVTATCAVLLLASCSTTLEGKPVSVFSDPFNVAGMPAVDGPTGLRSDATGPARVVEDTDGGPDDELMRQAISDIEEFWGGTFHDAFKGSFAPVEKLVSWDSGGYGGTFCDEDTVGLVNAAFCRLDKTIGWDRGELIPALRAGFGDMGAVMVMAHEYGHAVQKLAKLVNKNTPTLVSEQQADCFAGVYMRWVAEGSSKRFTLSTADGLNNVLAAMLSFRDPLLTADEYEYEGHGDEHGSAFERITAFQFGFTDGASSCAAIDIDQINRRRGDLPVALQADQTGELPVTEESVRSVVDALNIVFSPANPPELGMGTSASCTDARPSSPVSFCPGSNTIAVDLPALQKMGVKSEGASGSSLLSGDNSAYSVLTSRYMLAIQHEHGRVLLDNAEAALRTACLTGVATAKLSTEITTSDGNTIALTAGDLDEAVAGLLANGLVASDVNGETIPSGFTRMDAFRNGVLGDEDRCFKRFP